MTQSLSTREPDNRARAWDVIVYPDSAPDNWLEMLADLRVPCAVSPLHDRDVNPTGEVKKPHWHLVFNFDGKKSYEQVCEMIAPFHCPIPQRCRSVSGSVRYFTHQDNPEKAQYDLAEIRSFGGFDLAAALAPTSSQRYQLIGEMQAWIRSADIYEFEDLFNYAADFRREDWFPLLCDSCAYVMKLFLSSRRHRREEIMKGNTR